MKDKLAGYFIFFLSILTLGAWATFTFWGIVTWDSVTFIPQKVTVILIAAPIILAMLIVFIIAAWIGLTMARTPPPAPIDLEDFESLDEEKTKD